MKKVVTLGEIMLRLSAPNYQKILQANSFDMVESEFKGKPNKNVWCNKWDTRL
jgi:hypothetical protein